MQQGMQFRLIVLEDIGFSLIVEHDDIELD